MRVLVPAAARRSHRRDRRSSPRATTSWQFLKSVRARSTSCRWACPPPTGAATPAGELRARLDLGDRPVVLCSGAKRPHKNAHGAARRARADGRAARRSWSRATPPRTSSACAELRGGRGRVRLRMPPWLDQAGTSRASSRSRRCVVVPVVLRGLRPARARGDGRGVPVACSDRASLPEVAGDAALLVRPRGPGGRSPRRSSGCWAIRSRCASTAAAQRAAALHLGAHGAGSPLDGLPARVDAPRPSERGLEREPPRVAREPSGGALAQRGPPSCTRTIARPQVLRRRAEAATKPFTPSSTSSTAALSGARHDDARRAQRGRLDDDQAVALAARRQHHAQRAREAPARPLGRHEPGRLDDARRARSRCAAQHRLALGAVAEDLAAQLRDRARAPGRPPARARARASRGCGGRRTPRRAPRARGRAARASRRTRPRARVSSPSRAPRAQRGARAAARSRTRAAARAGRAPARRSRSARRCGPRYSRQ